MIIERESKWSIGIYKGDSPFKLTSPKNIKNPILTAKDITDISAKHVADPFMVKKDFTWYMFFEVMNAKTKKGEIGLATSNNGLNWNYKQIVLNEQFHLSYPYVFKWKEDYYMIPETSQTKSIRLYKSIDFPIKWSFIGTLLYGEEYVDSSIFQYKDKWWMFTAKEYSTLNLYYADNLKGPWIKHPKSPIIKGDANIARPGGKVLRFKDKIIRYAQDDYPKYGNQLRAFEITELTTTDYKEKQISEKPILKSTGFGWNAKGMHHIDPHQLEENNWIACVDGVFTKLKLFGTESKLLSKIYNWIISKINSLS